MARSPQPAVCQIVPRLQGGGVERGVIDVANALLDYEWSSYLISGGGDMVGSLKEAVHHLTYPVYSKKPWQILKNVRLLQPELLKMSCPILHVHSRAPAWTALLLSKKLNLPLITTYHGAYRSQSIFKKVYNSIMTMGQCVIAPSYYIKEHIMCAYPEKARDLGKRVRVIHPGVDIKVFNDALVSKERLHVFSQSFPFLDNKLVILLPARVSRGKGHFTLLQALGKFIGCQKLEEMSVQCVFAGKEESQEYKKSLLHMVQRLGLERFVTFIGPIHDMPALYKRAHIVLVPSIQPEAFGRVTAEAMAMKKIVIASNHGGSVEIIHEGEDGFLFKPECSLDLARVLLKALTLPRDQQDHLTTKAQEKVLASFTNDSMCQKTLEVYEEALQRHAL